MKKVYLLIFIILLIVAVSLFFLFRYDCDKNAERINAMLDEVNYCDIESDCIVTGGLACPFGCYRLANKYENLSQIDSMISEYYSRCIGCKYTCTEMGSLDLRCIEGKCVLQEI